MWLRVLGSAAGGGFPQWNCACDGCTAVRTGSRPCRPRTQSSVALSADDQCWYLVNASPDLRTQFESFPALRARQARRSPLRAVLLTDPELDHTLGLPLLREAGGLQLHATATVHKALIEGSGLLRLVAAYCPVTWHEITLNADTPLGTGLYYRAFDVPTDKAPRFGSESQTGTVIGFRLSDERSGRVVVYLPGVQALTGSVLDQLADCDCLLIDGTCWDNDELIRLGLAGKTARQMGHVPISGETGSLETLASLPIGRTIYTHINNTNPILLEDSPERRVLTQRGAQVATDGWEIRI